MSDLTVGDFWGLGEKLPFDGDQKDGVSLILVNTRKGQRLLEICKKERPAMIQLDEDHSVACHLYKK